MICTHTHTHTHIYIGKCLLVDYSLCLSKRIYTLTGGFISFIWIVALNFWSAFTCAFLRIPFPSLFTKPMANSTNTFTCVGVKLWRKNRAVKIELHPQTITFLE